MSGLYDNSRARSKIGPRTSSKKKSHVERAALRRRVIAGYPVETPFKTPEELYEYFNGDDRLTCLRCGKRFKALGAHLHIHGWNEQSYKEYYGIPWTYGLVCRVTKALHIEAGLKHVESGKAFGGDFSGNTRKSQGVKLRKRAPVLDIIAVRNGKKSPKSDPDRVARGEFITWKDADYFKLLDRMKEQDAPLGECAGNGLPSSVHTYKFARENADFRAALDKTYESLSFPAQSRGDLLGERFRAAIIKLYNNGLTQKQIGEQLGVHLNTVRRHLSKVST